ncbi:YfiR family protein [Methylophilus sp.]|uniref:YfiR family protein n=1 Tax=Methylophilus sp. TaxID=29541 RepID=UPI0040363E68
MKPSFCRRTQRPGLVSSVSPGYLSHSLPAMLQPGRRDKNRLHPGAYAAIRPALTFMLSCLGLTAPHPGWAASAPPDMRETTSELIFNLALLSQTPNRLPQESYNICAFEEDIGYLQSSTLESQKLQNLPLFLLPLKTIADVKRCNLLYIQDFIPQKPLELQQSIQKDAVLTVVHGSNKFSDYGHVVIHAQDKRYQFDLRIQPAKQAGLVFDARLLKLATNIIND